MSSRLIDLTGRRFGRLVVIQRVADRFTPRGHRAPWWEVVCDCGTRKETAGARLRNGQAASCGCLAREVSQSPLKPVVGYRGAHARVESAKGPATSHPCAWCDETAHTWAYNHEDPDERIATIPQRTGRGSRLRYSLNPDFYLPLCWPCHRPFDAEYRRSAS